MNVLNKVIPKSLVYEEHLGQPIYYKGYQKFLNHPENFSKNDIMGTSIIQSLIITEIINFLARSANISKQYSWFTNEIGLHFSKGENRACDIMIFNREVLKNYTKGENYFTIAPKIVIEVDIKADLENNSTFNYWQTKTQQLLDFGVEKVIWISTNPRKVTLATNQAAWLTQNWTESFEVLPDLAINLNDLIEQNNE
jgi:Uma2 family endonuclease